MRKKQNYVFSHNFLDNCHFVKIYSYRYFIFLQQYTISDKTIFYLPFFLFFFFFILHFSRHEMIVFEIIFRFITRNHFRRRAAQEPASGISAGFFLLFFRMQASSRQNAGRELRLLLPSPFTIFSEDRMRLGIFKLGNSVSPFASALAFHYLCPKMSGTQASPAAK